MIFLCPVEYLLYCHKEWCNTFRFIFNIWGFTSQLNISEFHIRHSSIGLQRQHFVFAQRLNQYIMTGGVERLVNIVSYMKHVYTMIRSNISFNLLWIPSLLTCFSFKRGDRINYTYNRCDNMSFLFYYCNMYDISC